MPECPPRLPGGVGQNDAALQQTESVLERISDAVVALDANWRYTYVNRLAARLFGRDPEQLIGKHIWTEFPEGVGQPFQLAYEKAMADQAFIQMENCYQPWNRWFENRIYPSRDGLTIFFHEITERKKAEQEARESAALLQAQNEILQRIAAGGQLAETLDTLLRTIEAHTLNSLICSILLIDSQDQTVCHVAAPSLPLEFVRGIDGQRIGPSAGSCGTAMFRREPVIVEDIATDPLWEDYRPLALEHGLRACWSTPIFDQQGAVLGAFALYFREPGRPSKMHSDLIHMATHTAAIAIVKDRADDALVRSEGRLRLAVTGANVGIWDWMVGSNRLVCSDELKAMLGWTAPHVTLGRFARLIDSRDQKRLRTAVRRLLINRENLDVEFRIKRADGSVRWITAKGRGQYSGRRPVRAYGVALDTTERNLAERQIARREAQLAEAQRIAHIGSYEWDVKSNAVYRSEELLRIFGMTAEQLPPTFEGYLERIHPDDRAATRAAIEKAFAERQRFAFEERIVRPDGEVRVLSSKGRWIFDDAREPVTLVGICQDITERKQAEQQLRESEERFQIVARATNDAIWDWNLETDAFWWNQGITTLFEYSRLTVGPDAAWAQNRIHPDDRDRVGAQVRSVIASGGQFWSAEYRFRRADQRYADILDRGFVVRDSNGKAIRMIGAMSDITERRRALEILEERVAARTSELQVINADLHREIVRREHVEELLRGRNEELKGFAYTVSHDLKAPLRGIAGYAKELERRHAAGLGDRARFCVQQVLTATANLDQLIEDLLQYSRLDTQNPGAAEVDVGAVISGILKDRKGVIAEQGAQVEIHLDIERVWAWERGLAQALSNLIDNALKYSRNATPPRILIASMCSGDDVLLTVSDNGIGFDMKYHDRVFGLFNRLVRQEDFEGTGLGLAIVKKVMEKMGGRAWAESRPNEGARFYLQFPIGVEATAEQR